MAKLTDEQLLRLNIRALDKIVKNYERAFKKTKDEKAKQAWGIKIEENKKTLASCKSALKNIQKEA